MHFRNLLVILMLLQLAACSRDKVVLEDFGESAVAVNAIIDRTGNLLQVKLVRAEKVIGGGNSNGEPISNATVAIVHGQDSIHFFYDPFMYNYQCMGDTTFFQDGEWYYLYIDVPGTGILRSQVKLIEKYNPVIDTALITTIPGKDVNSYDATLYIKDEPLKENYYRVIPLGEWVNDTDTADKIFFPFNGTAMYLFHDKEVWGDKLECKLNIPGMSFPGYTLKRLRFHCFNIEKFYYTYYSKLSENNASDQFHNPVFLPGNIQGGLGVFSSLNGQSEKSFNIP